MTYRAKTWTVATERLPTVSNAAVSSARASITTAPIPTRWPVRRQPGNRAAFALMELVVVSLIISLVAGATILSLSKPIRKARLERAITTLKDADRRARLAAQRSHTKVEYRIDRRAGIASHTTLGAAQETSRPLNLSSGLRIGQFMTADRSNNDDGLSIAISPEGHSETYAVRIATSSTSRDAADTWLVVVGASGQYIRLNEESSVEAIVRR